MFHTSREGSGCRQEERLAITSVSAACDPVANMLTFENLVLLMPVHLGIDLEERPGVGRTVGESFADRKLTKYQSEVSARTQSVCSL